jgi:hypothetical protein
MVSPRIVGNAVITPNGDVVMVGGCSDYYFNNTAHQPVRMTEVWDRFMGWQADAAQAASRMYHSTAAQLRSGNLVSAGGDLRLPVGGVQLTDEIDWEVYVPRTLANGQTVPQFQGAWANPGYFQLGWGNQYAIDYVGLPTGIAIARVVLMRPCSTSHHSDFDQRYIELKTSPGIGNTVLVTTPPAPIFSSTAQDAVTMLPGFYMAFLITTEEACSHAKWVKIP